MNDTSDTGWLVGERDQRRIIQELSHLISESGARSILLVDRNGRLVSSVGEPLVGDQQAFASLTAAEFNANGQLARMLGEPEFTALYHEGTKLSMFSADVAGRMILIVIFDRQTTLGMVRLRTRQSIGGLVAIFVDMFTRVRAGTQTGATEAGPLRGAQDEIDTLLLE